MEPIVNAPRRSAAPAANASLDAIVHAKIPPQAKTIAARPNPTSETV